MTLTTTTNASVDGVMQGLGGPTRIAAAASATADELHRFSTPNRERS